MTSPEWNNLLDDIERAGVYDTSRLLRAFETVGEEAMLNLTQQATDDIYVLLTRVAIVGIAAGAGVHSITPEYYNQFAPIATSLMRGLYANKEMESVINELRLALSMYRSSGLLERVIKGNEND